MKNLIVTVALCVALSGCSASPSAAPEVHPGERYPGMTHNNITIIEHAQTNHEDPNSSPPKTWQDMLLPPDPSRPHA